VPIVLKSGSLNLLEPSGPVKASNGVALPFTLHTWACRENGRNQNSQNTITRESGKTRLRCRPRNKWQDEVREDGRIFGGEEWQLKVYNREEWKKLLRMARSRRLLHMPME
jgi:hypothetical protein